MSFPSTLYASCKVPIRSSKLGENELFRYINTESSLRFFLRNSEIKTKFSLLRTLNLDCFSIGASPVAFSSTTTFSGGAGLSISAALRARGLLPPRPCCLCPPALQSGKSFENFLDEERSSVFEEVGKRKGGHRRGHSSGNAEYGRGAARWRGATTRGRRSLAPRGGCTRSSTPWSLSRTRAPRSGSYARTVSFWRPRRRSSRNYWTRALWAARGKKCTRSTITSPWRSRASPRMPTS
mmetsp:Transcript_6061/g.18349  ORF Transcript_6061/g.18349 Transcript_6061/m.18349 type:complete len:238 (+) Transcript_6061:212-925(+)